jgi:hypothetical protein
LSILERGLFSQPSFQARLLRFSELPIARRRRGKLARNSAAAPGALRQRDESGALLFSL